ncbi:hypothetical protein [Campylobacter sp.]|uniref:hypothetical protein n=1 Tax=Campylobacter sp. TaxID=205 RepID=UPI002586815D|nr:hypothetical protein [Campylobacter sp.]MCI6641045.1 hypothetical protein [Campylobacter sp.]
MENENLENKSNVKKSNLRDYDENPIVIKDELSNAKFLSIIFLIILFAIFIIRRLFFSQYDTIYHSNSTIGIGVFLTIMSFKNIFRNFEKDAQIHFYNDYIVKKLENGIEKRIAISHLKNTTKSISSMLPNGFIGEKIEKAILIYCGLFFVFVLALIIYRGEFKILIFISLFTFIVLYLPQFIIHHKYGGLKDSFYDVIWLQDKDGKFFNFMVSSDKQYNEIKKYLLVKTGKSLDKVEKKFFLPISWFKDKDLLN